MLYIVINVFIGGPLENQLVEGQPSLKELNMKYEIYRWTQPDLYTVFLGHQVYLTNGPAGGGNLNRRVTGMCRLTSEIMP